MRSLLLLLLCEFRFNSLCVRVLISIQINFPDKSEYQVSNVWHGPHSPKSIRVFICFIFDWMNVRSARRLRLSGGESGPMINFILRHFEYHWPLMWVVSLHIVTVGCALRCMRPSRRVHTLFGTDNNRNQFSWPNFDRAITTTANSKSNKWAKRAKELVQKSTNQNCSNYFSFIRFVNIGVRAHAQYKFHRKWAFVNGKNENEAKWKKWKLWKN